MELAILHYHFDKGGVTSVVLQAVRALRRHAPAVRRIVAAAGRIPADTAQALGGLGVELELIPELDYLEEGPGPEVQERAASLARLLTERLGGTERVWWVHNYHLGKNPVLTEALLRLAAAPDGPPLLLHVHDFPEGGRYANLRRLRGSISRPLYPLGPRVRYAVLTVRDLRALTEAGVPRQRVALLENPVSPPVVPSADRGEVRRALARAFGWPAAGQEGAPLLLYPVRAIRRKNVLEAALLSRLLPGGCGLVVTLPGASAQERPYAERIARAFREGLAQGLYGIGGRLPEAGIGFADLLAAADLVVCSSVQEGFGYLFIDALQWQLPLLARELAILEGTQELFSGYPALLYRQLHCPWEGIDRQELERRYRAREEGLADLLGARVSRRLRAGLEEVLAAPLAEFSYLPADLQIQVLARLRDPSFREACREMNGALLAGGERLLHRQSSPPSRQARVRRRFGLRRYAETLQALLEELDGAPRGGAHFPAVLPQRVLERLSEPGYLRLLVQE